MCERGFLGSLGLLKLSQIRHFLTIRFIKHTCRRDKTRRCHKSRSLLFSSSVWVSHPLKATFDGGACNCIMISKVVITRAVCLCGHVGCDYRRSQCPCFEEAQALFVIRYYLDIATTEGRCRLWGMTNRGNDQVLRSGGGNAESRLTLHVSAVSIVWNDSHLFWCLFYHVRIFRSGSFACVRGGEGRTWCHLGRRFSRSSTVNLWVKLLFWIKIALLFSCYCCLRVDHVCSIVSWHNLNPVLSLAMSGENASSSTWVHKTNNTWSRDQVRLVMINLHMNTVFAQPKCI